MDLKKYQWYKKKKGKKKRKNGSKKIELAK